MLCAILVCLVKTRMRSVSSWEISLFPTAKVRSSKYWGHREIVRIAVGHTVLIDASSIPSGVMGCSIWAWQSLKMELLLNAIAKCEV